MAKTISIRMETVGQVCDYTSHVKLGAHMLRVRVHVDGYVSQSWGQIERWDGTQWHEVASLQGSSLAVNLEIAYAAGRKPSAFACDHERLVMLAMEILS